MMPATSPSTAANGSQPPASSSWEAVSSPSVPSCSPELVSKLANVALPELEPVPVASRDGAVPVAGVVELADLLVHGWRSRPRAGLEVSGRGVAVELGELTLDALSEPCQASSKAAPEPRAISDRLSFDLASNPAIRACAVDSVAA